MFLTKKYPAEDEKGALDNSSASAYIGCAIAVIVATILIKRDKVVTVYLYIYIYIKILHAEHEGFVRVRQSIQTRTHP